MPEPEGAPDETATGGEGPPDRSFAKRVVDPLNSIVWFAMDAFWMCKLSWPAYAFAALAAATGVWLVVLGWRRTRRVPFGDLGLNCWIAMNVIWMASDLNNRPTPLWLAVPLAVIGAAFIAVALRRGQEFRRLRLGDR